jgi:hypothetical protein
MRFQLECKVGDRKTYGPHRREYEREYGPLGDGREIHHLCCNIACIEPEHLISVTRAQHRALFDCGRSKHKHCKRGHPRTPENLTTGRTCKICNQDRYRSRML